MEEYVIDGKIKSGKSNEDFDIEFTLQNSQLKIKGLSKFFLLDKLTELPKEHGIYILEGLDKCYIGQTKDISKRIKNHKDSNKVDFIRCFFLSQKGGDLRQYLDFMEAYTIQQMELMSYELDNTKKPNPDQDMLDLHKKNMVKKWINEFLLFLPILGFRKSKIEKSILNKEVVSEIDTTNISVQINNKIISGENNKDAFVNFIKEIGAGNCYKTCNNIFNNAFRISEIFEKHAYATCDSIIENKKEYFIYVKSSKKDLIKKINKIIELMSLDAKIL